jgi:hypothetical protein
MTAPTASPTLSLYEHVIQTLTVNLPLLPYDLHTFILMWLRYDPLVRNCTYDPLLFLLTLPDGTTIQIHGTSGRLTTKGANHALTQP